MGLESLSASILSRGETSTLAINDAIQSVKGVFDAFLAAPVSIVVGLWKSRKENSRRRESQHC